MISIILPTYNENENIVGLINRIDRVVSEKKEILVVDDHSPDGTAKKVEELIKSQKIHNLRLTVRKKNHGLTNSIQSGIKLAVGDIIVWMDADFSHPPEVIPKLIGQIKNGYDIAVASRFIKGGGYKKNTEDSNDSQLAVILSRLMNYTIQFLLDRRFKDYSSGFIAAKRKIFDQITLRGDYGEYFIDLMTRAILLGYTFVEIPFVNLPRKHGQSKTGRNLFQLISRGTKYILLAIRLFFLRHGYKIGIIDDITG